MIHYRVLPLEQGSDAWKQARFDYFTASDAGVLFDLHPNKTRYSAFIEKLTRTERKVSASTQTLFEIGHQAEAKGRQYVESTMGVCVPPAVVVSEDTPDLLASLDGFDTKKGIIFEAKYIGRDALDDVKRGKVKPHHECQVQAQLYVTGAEKCIYFALDPNGEAAVLTIKPDTTLQRQIAEGAAKFMRDLRAGIEPSLSMRDTFTPTGDARFLDMMRLNLEIKEREEKLEQLRETVLKDYADHYRVASDGVLITRSIRKGSVQYAKIPQLKGVDLDKYRAASKEIVTIRYNGGEV